MFQTSVPHSTAPTRAKTNRRYQGWQRDTQQAQGFRGTLSLKAPGTGSAVSWIGFNTPTVGGNKPRAWVQIGLTAQGRPYLEYQQPNGTYKYLDADNVTGPIKVAVVRTKYGWQARLNGKAWGAPLKLGQLGQMFAGTEWLDDAQADMSVGNLNVLVGGQWKPFRGAQKVSTTYSSRKPRG